MESPLRYSPEEMAWLLFYISHRLELKDIVLLHSRRFPVRTFDGIKKRLSKERRDQSLGQDRWDIERFKNYLRNYIIEHTLSEPDADGELSEEDTNALQR